MFLLLALVAVLTWWASWRLRNHRLLALAGQLPGPPAWPGLGNALTFNVPPEEIFGVIGKLKQQYGRAFKFWLGPELNYCISEPEDVKILLQSTKTSTRGPQYKYMTDFLGYGILSGSGPVWRKHRKLISPYYSINATKTYTNVFNAETGFLLERLRNRAAGESFNIYEEVVKTTTYTICQTFFGLTREQASSLPHLQEILDQTHQLYGEVFIRITTWYLQIAPIYWLSEYYPRHRKCIQQMLLMTDTIVKHRIKKLDAMGVKTIDENDDDIKELSIVDRFVLTNTIPDYEEMLKQIFAVFTTSQEAGANVGCFLLLMLAYHPECQEKLYAEIKTVFGDVDRDVTDEDIKRMPYLNMALKETLRLFPAASMVQRKVTEDIEIRDGITLPAGSSLLVPIFHMQRDPEVWPEPDAFDPERFSPERSASRHPCSFIPFSLGAMNCPGTARAQLLLLAALWSTGARSDTVTWYRCIKNEPPNRLQTYPQDHQATILNLTSCNINKISRIGYELPNLKEIHLNWNKIDQVDPTIFMSVSTITRLFLNNNNLQLIPVFKEDLLPNLIDLYLDSNQIKTISHSETFSGCAHLESLHLYNNQIEYIHPDAFKPLNNLRELFLYRNRISFISSGMFQLQSLELITLNRNLIEYVAPEAFRGSKLHELYLDSNRISHLPVRFATEMVSRGARLDKFRFESNPWNCASLLEMLADVKKAKRVLYYNFWAYSGTRPVCIYTGRYPCLRRVPSTLLRIARPLDGP